VKAALPRMKRTQTVQSNRQLSALHTYGGAQHTSVCKTDSVQRRRLPAADVAIN